MGWSRLGSNAAATLSMRDSVMLASWLLFTKRSLNESEVLVGDAGLSVGSLAGDTCIMEVKELRGSLNVWVVAVVVTSVADDKVAGCLGGDGGSNSDDEPGGWYWGAGGWYWDAGG